MPRSIVSENGQGVRSNKFQNIPNGLYLRATTGLFYVKFESENVNPLHSCDFTAASDCTFTSLLFPTISSDEGLSKFLLQ